MKAFILTAVLFSSNAFAWGPTGHRVVGAVADKFLTIEVASKIHTILGGKTMAQVSTWSDEIKSEPETYSHTFNWHFTDWRDEDHQHDETHSSGKLLTAIKEQLDVLKNQDATPDQKEFALKFIVHLVGDLHMPFHVGNGLDRGGNSCRVTFHGQKTNLHALWDDGMIAETRLSYTELTNFVVRGRSFEDIIAWKKGTAVDWARESKDLRSAIYPQDVVPSKAQMSVKQYCRTDIVVSQEEMPKLSYEYSYKFVPVVEKRLFQAGLRLAVLLNETLK